MSTGSAAVRMERDGLGERAVPAEALYGIHTVRALENLGFSSRPLGSCPVYVRTLGMVKRATAHANKAAEILEPRIAAAIETATAPLIAGELLQHFPVDLFGGGGSIGIHMNVNEVVANLANESLGGRRGDYTPVTARHVGASQSTADVCHTAVRLAILQEWEPLKGVLARATQTLRDREQSFASIPTLARTCLQDALPTSLGVLFGGYAALMARRAQSLEASVHALRAIALGGTVIGSGDGAPARYRAEIVPQLAEVTGFPLVARTPLPDALQNSDDIADVSAQLRLLAESLIKVAQDLRLLASGPSGGFGEIRLPPVQEGSSFFAGKQNPVIAETVMQCAFLVLGCDRAVQAATEHAELYLNVFDGLAAVQVLDALALLCAALERFEARCLRGLQADEERCRALAALGRGAAPR